MTKICTKCKVEKALDQFHKGSPGHRFGRHNKCKKCTNEDNRISKNNKMIKRPLNELSDTHCNWAKDIVPSLNGYKLRAYRLKRDYNLTIEEYDLMVLNQNNRCAICNKEELEIGAYGEIKNLCVDHCHKTGRIRGLLCGQCNKGLGQFKDKIDSLLSAVEYLKKSCLMGD